MSKVHKEIWKDIEGYEGLYQVSNLGRIKGLKRNKILKSAPAYNGYLRVDTCSKNKHRSQSIHRLVGIAFIPNPQRLPQINHKNGIKADNRVENLEWVTASQNQKHAFKTGLSSARFRRSNKLNKSSVIAIKAAISGGQRNHVLAKRYAISQVTISDIKHGRTWWYV